MRVISGNVRGLKLSSPTGIDTRPTLDRVKEAVFSMLLPHINDAVVLDLFAGSGALGIEALSRGAKKAVFVDNSNDAILCVQSNVSSAKMADTSEIRKSDAKTYLSTCSERFDIIFLDPPYAKGLYQSVLEIICARNLLSDDGIIVAEWDFEKGFTDELYDFEIYKMKKYGRVGITVLKRGLSE